MMRLLWRNVLVTLTLMLWVANVSMATMLWEAHR
jgi:hypothetical protein